jgi:hypothetical protein
MRDTGMRVLFYAMLSTLLFTIVSCRNFSGILHNDTTITMQQGLNGYAGTTDCHILEWGPDNNTGGNDILEVCRYPQNQQNDDKYGLIRFDVSQIPADAEIINAVLQVYYTGVRNGTAEKIVQCHLVTASWNEGSGIGLNGQSGSGATWNLRPAFVTTILDSQILGAETNNWYSFDIASEVSMWVQGSTPNYGVLLKPEMDDSFPQNAPGTKQIASSEHTILSIRPKLIVTYREFIYLD